MSLTQILYCCLIQLSWHVQISVAIILLQFRQKKNDIDIKLCEENALLNGCGYEWRIR